MLLDARIERQMKIDERAYQNYLILATIDKL